MMCILSRYKRVRDNMSVIITELYFNFNINFKKLTHHHTHAEGARSASDNSYCKKYFTTGCVMVPSIRNY